MLRLPAPAPVLLLLLPVVSLRQDPAGPRRAFEAAAERLEAIDYGDVLYGRVGPRGAASASSRGPEVAALAALLARDDPLEEVLALLEHPDPRVRTLALVELYDREDPRLLPRMVPLADDGGSALPQVPFYSAAIVGGPDGPRRVPETAPPPEPRTVGQVARQLVGFYLERAGFHYGLEGYRDHPGWEVYWAERAERMWCASWLSVQQVRAHGAVSRSPAATLPRLRPVRARVDALPAGERELVLLWLPDLDGAFSSDAERLAAAKSLGRGRLLAILRREPPTDDPDLLPRIDANAGRYPLGEVARFVLEHAGELLVPEDVAALLALEVAEQARADSGDAWPMRTARWRIAAAQLDAGHAREHLEQAWSSYQDHDWPEAVGDRMALLLQAWRSLGVDADSWVAQRFWAETRRPGYWPYGPTQLVDALADDGSDRARGLLAALVRHPGFADCDWILLEHLARRIDAWTEPDVIGEGELRAASHPLGAGPLATAAGRTRAAEQHPEATGALLERLDAWRARLLESTPRWEHRSR